MTQKEKAQEIYNKLVVHIQRYDEYVDDRSKFKTIQCALIAVDEIMKITSESYDIDHINWWKEVKQEIEKL
jgi:hypothetical protein